MGARDDALRRLETESFDLLVVGAGIHGASAAWTAARLGLKTALIDAGDFGAATSANSLKVIHGGLRYLQHGNFKRMRESILARRRFLQLAPALVRPQAFAIPTRGWGVRSRMALRAALWVNDLVSFDRNYGVNKTHQLPCGRILSRREAAELWPLLPAASYDGAALWYDALAHDIERLTLAFALSASWRGAAVANYVRAVRILESGGAVSGVLARDEIADAEFAIGARAVLNAAGPWWKTWCGRRGREHPLVGAWNLVVRKRWFGSIGVGLESRQEHLDPDALIQRGRRNLFFVPWREGTMVGTVYEPYSGDPADYRPSPGSIEAFIREINAVLPGAGLEAADITLLHIGVQPASTAGGSPEPDKHSEIQADALRGLFHIKGVKYTTGLSVGETAARRIARMLGVGNSAIQEDALIGAEPLAGDLRTQTRRAVEHEFAVRLSDVVIRRTGLGTFSRPPDSEIECMATEMARILDWSAVRLKQELELLEQDFRWFRP